MRNIVSRREFLKYTSGAVAGVAAVPAVSEAARAVDAGAAGLSYKQKSIGKAAAIVTNQPLQFSFPDAASPCTLVKMGAPVMGGVGPGGDIVAYSTMCTHMGCAVAYDEKERVFKCPCHFSTFDAENGGQMICGQATANLPRIVLKYNDKDDSITALSVDGLLYGRQSNVL